MSFDFEINDRVELNEDCCLDNHNWLDDRRIRPGDKARVIDIVGRDADLIEIQFLDNGQTEFVYWFWIDFVDRPTPNDSTQYDHDLFTWAGVQV